MAYLKTGAAWASPSSYSQSSACASSFLNASLCFSVVTYATWVRVTHHVTLSLIHWHKTKTA